MPTLTPTWTASPDRDAPPATRTPTTTAIPTVVVEPASGPPAGRLLVVVLVFLASGGLLTAGVIYFVRGNAGKTKPPGIEDV